MRGCLSHRLSLHQWATRSRSPVHNAWLVLGLPHLRTQPWRREIIYALDRSAATTTVRRGGERRCNLSSPASSDPIGIVGSVRKVSAGACDFASSTENKSDRAVRHPWLAATPPGSKNCGLFLHQQAFISPLCTVHNQAPSPKKLSAEKYEKYQIQSLSQKINHKKYLFEIS